MKMSFYINIINRIFFEISIEIKTFAEQPER